MKCCDEKTSSILADFFGPEFIPLRKMRGQKYTVLTYSVAGTVATVTGFIKPFIGPVIAALGLIIMPIKAGIASYKGDVEGTKAYLKAWGFCALTVGGTIAFMGVTGFCMPLVVSATIVVAIVALSVIMHVQKAMREVSSFQPA